MRRLVLSVVALAMLTSFGGACDGKRGWRDPLTNELLDYPEIDMVTFNVAGTIACPRCESGEINVVAVRVEVLPKDNPLDDALAVRMMEGVGPFTISNLRYRSGARLGVLCHIYTSVDLESIGMTREVEVRAPNNDGDTVAVTINF